MDNLGCIVGALLYVLASFVFPAWAGWRASQRGFQGWALIAWLSIFIGAGAIGGLLALLNTAEPQAAKAKQQEFDVDGVHYRIESVVSRGEGQNKYLIVLFGASNASTSPQQIDSSRWRARIGASEFLPTRANLGFSRADHTTLNPGLSESQMIVGFNVPPDILQKGTTVRLLIPQNTNTCPSCGTENRPQSKFCARCGSALRPGYASIDLVV
ncbi:MAG: hypothetical protein B6D41_01685 [Chloroflexi bacterium UTCFX4]|jgi:hypothetical protein|nr:MAG: hypothetical protein B6D41_01685 [Chloroflexi bacterium UTCFX4]